MHRDHGEMRRDHREMRRDHSEIQARCSIPCSEALLKQTSVTLVVALPDSRASRFLKENISSSPTLSLVHFSSPADSAQYLRDHGEITVRWREMAGDGGGGGGGR